MRKKVDRSEVFAELLPGAAPEATGELLKDLHLLTRDGDLNADARRKMKQIRHLLQLLAPAIDDVLARHADPIIVDCGAGKSYLGFLLYVTRLAREARGRLVSIESRPELVAATAERAARFGCARMTAVAGTIAEAPLPERVH
ncbi:MAG: methyltransferase, partial [Kofleriaceae bacterium]